MPQIEDHPLRFGLANELHARPFPALTSPCQAAYLALKPAQDAAARDRGADRAHLLALLDRYGVDHPAPDATHYFADLGRFRLKWESHTEFVSYTVFSDGLSERAFDPASFDVFPAEWLATAPGQRVTSALIRVEAAKSDEALHQDLEAWFVPESLAVSSVLDASAVIAGDFRIDGAGHMRFALYTGADMGPRRIGRIVQRLCEIETYKSMSMLGFARVRDLGAALGRYDRQLSALMSNLQDRGERAEDTLDALLGISADLEQLMAQASFRFGATAAYEALVHQRIEVLREVRIHGRQTFAEFMMRRFDPAMRTVKATERRLQAMANRAIRAGDLLRTRVDVERSAQNAALLESMDRRADAQLKLQRTVEGLSVVAISYYAVSLASYMVQPFAEGAGVSKAIVTAALTPFVVGLVWLIIRRIRKAAE